MIYQIKKMFKNCPKPDGWYGCFATDEYDCSVKLTGKTTLPIGEGLIINIEDKDVTDDGDGFKVSAYEILTDTNSRMINYLSLAPTVARFQARMLVQQYGTDVLKVLAEDPDKIAQTAGLSNDDVESLAVFTKNITALMSIKKLAPVLTEPQIKKIINHFDNPMETLTKNPYDLLDIEIPWMITDNIALTVAKIAPNSRYRINHAIVYAVKIFIEQTKNICVNLDNQSEADALTIEINKLLMSQYATAVMVNEIRNIANIPEIPLIIENFNQNNYLYEEVYYVAECSVAKLLHNNKNIYTKNLDAEIREYISEFMLQENQNLSDEQQNAIVKSLTNKFSVITGGPGTGKTTITKCLYYVYQKLSRGPIRLLAPTGKASKKLSESTGHDAFTLARFLISKEYPEFLRKILLSRSTAPKWEWDGLIIVDETSMIDIREAAQIMSLAEVEKKEVQFIFIGDTHQLPPIEPGSFFHDVIASQKIPTSFLTTCYRNSGVIEKDAALINNGDTNLQWDLQSTMLYPLNDDSANTFDYIVSTYNQMRIESDSVALLCPVKNGPIGTTSLNLKLHDEILPANKNTPALIQHKYFKREYINEKGYEIPNTFYGTKELGWARLRIGSKVIQITNNPELKRYDFTKKSLNYFLDDRRNEYTYGAYNGDIGTIIAYYPPDVNRQEDAIIAVEMEDNTVVHYNMAIDDHKQLQLAYAITIHKSQGSEYDNVIIAVPQRLLFTPQDFTTRNLIYTAFTRARNNVTLIGNKEALNRCILTPMPKRNSNLAERI